GGFSPYGDSIARFSPAQQYVLAATMFSGGINFMLLYNLFTLRFNYLRGKMDQLRAYFGITLAAIVAVTFALRWKMGYAWPDAIRLATVQSVSAATTSGSLAADTGQWWPPILFLYLILAFCGGMAGSTSGGLKTMRVLILLRNVRTILRGRLHPHAVNPVRLNGKPVPDPLISNVTVIFLIFVLASVVCAGLLVLCGVGANEAIGGTVACITGYGSGLGNCGGMHNFSLMPVSALWILSVAMLLGRLEFMTLLILILPDFWRK
ncbi:MAG: potassium transporter TrkG, partial [Bacteroidales bacterium]|nr:potassium transporter TrkG [Bacteroidales bacterium]